MATTHGNADLRTEERIVATRDGYEVGGRGAPRTRRTTETKSSFKTSEFYVLIAAVAGVLVAAYADSDSFARDHAWTLVAVLAVGYMVSRGLAKLGNREPYWDGDAH
jgi:di/tricarboxylate transporter